MFAQSLDADEGANEQEMMERVALVTRWCEDWGNCALVGLAGYVVVYLLWLTLGWGSDNVYDLVIELGFIPVLLLGLGYSIRAVRFTSGDAQTQRAWGAIGLGLGLLAIAESIWSWHVIATTSAPFPSWADAFYIGSLVALLTGILSFPTPSVTRSDFFRYVLDIAIILVGGAALAGVLLIGPENLIGRAMQLESVLLLLYPTLDLMLIIAIASKILRRPRAGKIGMLSVLAVGIVANTSADLGWVIAEVDGTYRYSGATYALWMVAYAFLAASPQRQVDIVRRNLPLVYPGELAARIQSLVSYIAAGTAISVFLLAAAPRLIDQFGLLLALMLLLLALIALRQFQVLRENTQYQIEQVRQESDARIHALVEYSSDMISVLDEDLRFRFQSPVVQELTGEPPEAFIGTRVVDWAHEDDRDSIVQTVRDLLDGNDRETRFEWRLRGWNGLVIHLESIASRELDTPGVHGIVLNSRDISERKLFERELTYQAYNDALTGLPNRTSFLKTVMRQLKSVGPEKAMAMVFIDLDRFKPVNDTLGHDAGDALLKQVAWRLGLSLRDEDTLSRFAGDEFTVLLPGISSRAEAMIVADRVRQVMEQSFTVFGTEITISSSIGVAYTETPRVEPQELLRQADAAMYAAKRNGRNRVELFEP